MDNRRMEDVPPQVRVKPTLAAPPGVPGVYRNLETSCSPRSSVINARPGSASRSYPARRSGIVMLAELAHDSLERRRVDGGISDQLRLNVAEQLGEPPWLDQSAGSHGVHVAQVTCVPALQL